MIKFECSHADTCLPDYWGGHHLPHASIPVWRGMSLQDIKDNLKSEVSQGAIAGNLPENLTDSGYDLNDTGYTAFEQAIADIVPNNPDQTEFFLDLEEQDEDADFSVYAYFVFVEI